MPLELCFNVENWNDELLFRFVIAIIPLMALLIDIILTLNTAFYEKGVLIDDKA